MIDIIFSQSYLVILTTYVIGVLIALGYTDEIDEEFGITFNPFKVFGWPIAIVLWLIFNFCLIFIHVGRMIKKYI